MTWKEEAIAHLESVVQLLEKEPPKHQRDMVRALVNVAQTLKQEIFEL